MAAESTCATLRACELSVAHPARAAHMTTSDADSAKKRLMVKSSFRPGELCTHHCFGYGQVIGRSSKRKCNATMAFICHTPFSVKAIRDIRRGINGGPHPVAHKER